MHHTTLYLWMFKCSYFEWDYPSNITMSWSHLSLLDDVYGAWVQDYLILMILGQSPPDSGAQQMWLTCGGIRKLIRLANLWIQRYKGVRYSYLDRWTSSKRSFNVLKTSRLLYADTPSVETVPISRVCSIIHFVYDIVWLAGGISSQFRHSAFTPD